MRPWLIFCGGILAVSFAVGAQPVLSQEDQSADPSPQTAEPAATASAPVNAAVAADNSPTIIPYFNRGYVDQGDLQNLVGSVTYSMDACSTASDYFHNSDDRVVRATLQRVPQDFEDRPDLSDTLLRNAAQFAWRNCPVPYVDLSGQPKGDFHYDLRTVGLYGPDGALVVSAGLGSRGMDGYGDQALWSGLHGYIWRDYRNGLQEQRAQAAQVQQQQAVAVQQQAQQAVDAEQGRERGEAFWWKVRLFGLGALLIWVLIKREAIARWYYSLQPHPVTHMVDRAVHSGSQIDGDIYERILSPIPGSRIEKEVRARQARDLTSRLRQHEAALQSEETRCVDEERRRVEQENAFARAHAELLKAGIDHAVATARLDELKKATRRP